ncbi:unnamed protein product [Zymoseptoria tritici ST99CH_1A5]|uniref:C2H2-type domain-containing protein n=1 Tax=Zymoseptoria tritici ST99CH_1A5 TaxID=1276529 RepID=A0A1Y6LNQ0_ZYMTR|nr:unnamed protein product [Zymoseptoria tritici ST99CH_1A5]
MPLSRWALSSYTYEGLCTHFSVNEGYKWDRPDPSLSREEVNAAYAEHLEAKAAAYRPAKAANTKRYGDSVVAEQRFVCKPCGGLTFRSRAKQLEHEKRQIHKDKAAGITKERRRMTKNFWCHECNWQASCSKRLVIHLNGVRHAAHVRDKAAAAAKAAKEAS